MFEKAKWIASGSYGARIQTRYSDEIGELAETINDEHFQLCLDTGHGWIRGTTPGDAVRMAGKTLKVLHVHDNVQLPDPHLVPGMGTIDWDDFMAALRETEFDGVLSLECELDEFFPDLDLDIRFEKLKAVAADLLNKIS